MYEDGVRLLQLEGQVHALARAWLQLAAAVEIEGLTDPAVLDEVLLGSRWPGLEIEPHAQRTMQHLVEQLAEARANRRLRDHYLLGRPEGRTRRGSRRPQ